jgi:hypothetical protein
VKRPKVEQPATQKARSEQQCLFMRRLNGAIPPEACLQLAADLDDMYLIPVHVTQCMTEEQKQQSHKFAATLFGFVAKPDALIHVLGNEVSPSIRLYFLTTLSEAMETLIPSNQYGRALAIVRRFLEVHIAAARGLLVNQRPPKTPQQESERKLGSHLVSSPTITGSAETTRSGVTGAYNNVPKSSMFRAVSSPAIAGSAETTQSGVTGAHNNVTKSSMFRAVSSPAIAGSEETARPTVEQSTVLDDNDDFISFFDVGDDNDVQIGPGKVTDRELNDTYPAQDSIKHLDESEATIRLEVNIRQHCFRVDDLVVPATIPLLVVVNVHTKTKSFSDKWQKP